jgi:hypothetical protein
VKPRDIARAVIAAGWLAGMVLILAGLPWPAALAAPAVAISAAITFLKWRGNLLAWLTAAVTRLRKARKTGGVLERA